jgi:hypothetical protein
MARATTADSRRSALNFGKMRPFETECRSCPRADALQAARDRLRAST